MFHYLGLACQVKDLESEIVRMQAANEGPGVEVFSGVNATIHSLLLVLSPVLFPLLLGILSPLNGLRHLKAVIVSLLHAIIR